MQRKHWQWLGFFAAGTFLGSSVLGGLGRMFGRR